MWAKKAGSTNVPVGIVRHDDQHIGKDKVWSLIARGAGYSESENFGLPVIKIRRTDALRLKKKFGLREDKGMYVGSINLEDFRGIEKSDVNADDKTRKELSKQAWKNFEEREKFHKKMKKQWEKMKVKDARTQRMNIPSSAKEKFDIEEYERSEGISEEPEKKPDFTIAKEIHNQLGNTKISGFPFYAYTGIKPTIISETDLHLKPPTNPNKVTAINVHYNGGSDEYDVRFQSGKKIDELKGLQWDNLGEVIVRKMGVT